MGGMEPSSTLEDLHQVDGEGTVTSFPHTLVPTVLRVSNCRTTNPARLHLADNLASFKVIFFKYLPQVT